jgi:hypothetical protein
MAGHPHHYSGKYIHGTVSESPEMTPTGRRNMFSACKTLSTENLATKVSAKNFNGDRMLLTPSQGFV